MDTLKYDQKINGYFLTISNRGNAISNFITIYFFTVLVNLVCSLWKPYCLFHILLPKTITLAIHIIDKNESI